MATTIAFARALMGRDATAALDYFSDGARVLTGDGTEVSGAEAIGGVLEQVTAASRRLEIRPGRTIVSGDVALCSQSWRLLSSGDPVPSFERANKATFVLQNHDRRWQIVIASPWA